MDFQLSQSVAAPVEAVDAALVDAEFLRTMATLPKLGSAEVLSQQRDGDVVVQEVRYLFQAELSGAVTKVVDPARLTWVEASQCDLSSHRSHCEIRPDYYANLLSGRYQAVLEPDGGGTRRTVRGVIEVHVPLVGGRVERAIVSGLEENAAAQAELLTRWLAPR